MVALLQMDAPKMFLAERNIRFPERGFILPYYPDCGVARVLGVTPIGRDTLGYRRPLDADNDGIACEPLPRRRIPPPDHIILIR